MTVDVMHVPQRETGMMPYEIMLSESQERMLLVVEKGREHEVEAVFDKWDLHAVKVGEVTEGTRLQVYERGTLVADVPNRALTDEAPVYERPMEVPSWQAHVQQLSLADLGEPPTRAGRVRHADRGRRRSPASGGRIASTITASAPTRSRSRACRPPSCASRTPTARSPCRSTATAASVISIRSEGAMLAVAEAARNVACAGGEPIGATNNLNFGNPERPEIMWQIGEAVRGIGEACRALDTPITGGNVSLYNETEGHAIFPTPVIGVVGLLEDASKTVTRTFKTAGSAVVLLGDNLGELGGSEYLATMHNLVAGRAPELNLKREAALQTADHQADSRRLHRIRARLLRRRSGGHAGGMHVRQRRPRRQRRHHRCRRRAVCDQRDAVRRIGVADRALGEQPSDRHGDGGGEGRPKSRRGRSAASAAITSGSASMASWRSNLR